MQNEQITCGRLIEAIIMQNLTQSMSATYWCKMIVKQQISQVRDKATSNDNQAINNLNKINWAQKHKSTTGLRNYAQETKLMQSMDWKEVKDLQPIPSADRGFIWT